MSTLEQSAKVTSVTESTTTYILASNDFNLNNKMIKVFPNPASDLIAIQIGDLVTSDLKIELFDITGRLIKSNQINAGQTITYFDVQDIYNGTYLVKITDGKDTISKTIIIDK
uniref:T9SS type A sorting domain-containing protein n=1 Tax=Flavobacterium sp. TaxID=239 RepID=UPI00404AA745